MCEVNRRKSLLCKEFDMKVEELSKALNASANVLLGV